MSQWSPAFGAGKSPVATLLQGFGCLVAMEPSFWSWEKGGACAHRPCHGRGRNGAQLLELGKACWSAGFGTVNVASQWSPAFGAGKSPRRPKSFAQICLSQWSPAFGAGKRSAAGPHRSDRPAVAMEPSFWSWEKILRVIDYSKVCRSQWSPAFGAGKS